MSVTIPRNAAEKLRRDAPPQQKTRHPDQFLVSSISQVVVEQACTSRHIGLILARFVHKSLTLN
jgi:hypothetical protein